jgi:Putative peptidoglycan binding domain
MKRLSLIAVFAFTWLPAAASARPIRPHAKLKQPSHLSSHRVSPEVSGHPSSRLSSLIAKNSYHSSNSAMRTHASLRTVSFRTPARATGTSLQTSTPASKSAAASKKKRTTRKKRIASRIPSQKAPTPERISEIQSALSRGGYYQNDPNGKWDGDTIGALQKFQSANGLEPTGKLDALSLQKMGLGSEIAGVSAPRPIVRPSSIPVPSGSAAAATAPGSAPAVGGSPSPGASTPPAGGTSPSDAPQR